MDLVTFNAVESIGRAVKFVARTTIGREQAAEIHDKINHHLTVSKIAMQRDQDASIEQSMAALVAGLAKFTLGREPRTDGDSYTKEFFTATLADLKRHYEVRQEIGKATMHPDGQCTCAGEGRCPWCQTHCVHCGELAEQHGPGSTHYFEPHGGSNGSESPATPALEVAGDKEPESGLPQMSIGSNKLFLWFKGTPAVSISRTLPEELTEELLEVCHTILVEWAGEGDAETGIVSEP